MPQITLNIKAEKNTVGNIMSAQELRDKFLFGIDISKGGKEMPDSTLDYFIQAAKVEIEQLLSIKMDLQVITENKDFHYDDWRTWSQVKCTYFIQCALALTGFIGGVKQVDYPVEWLSTRKTSDGELFSRLMHVVPNSYATFNQSAALYIGYLPNAGWLGGARNTPEYWTIKYITGFKVVPANILQAVGMLASINVLAVANETMAAALGALGSSSKSISIDGLSESTSLYINGQTGIFGARIKQYTERLMGDKGKPGIIDNLRDYYGNFVWTVL